MEIYVPSPWKKIVAIGCTHGHLGHPLLIPQALAFINAWDSDHTGYRVHLGDVIDTTAFRGGANGTPDERVNPEPDANAAAALFKAMEPTHYTMGNHCKRLLKAMNSTSALVAHSARTIWDEIREALPPQCVVTPWHIRKNWVQIGGYWYGHGNLIGINATRDHAEMCGGACVHAHTHGPCMAHGRTFDPRPSFCVGTLADIELLTYAEERRATLVHGHGLVYGYADQSTGRSQLWLAQSAPGELLPLPTV